MSDVTIILLHVYTISKESDKDGMLIVLPSHVSNRDNLLYFVLKSTSTIISSIFEHFKLF